ncbi:MAG: 30S ribosomal protein S20 [Chitinophagales bacterium]|nr:30S ribosomal protein S20 [Chitinophagales bacterium]
MANTKNAQKAMRQAEKRRTHNRLHAKTTRNAIKKLRLSTKKDEALKNLPEVISLVDKLAKRGVIHKKKADNLKSGLSKKINSLNK